MNQEVFVRATRWILYVSVGVLAVSVFFVFFSKQNGRNFAKYDAGGVSGERGVKTTGMGISDRSFSKGMMDPGNATLEEGGLISAGTEPMPAPPERMAAGFSGPGDVAPASDIAPVDMQKKVIRNGNLSIRVEDAEWSADEIDRIAIRLGGFTSSRDISDQSAYPVAMMREIQPMMKNVRDAQNAKGNASGNIQSGVVVVKVPSVKFNEAVSAIKGIASVVLNESSSASDVSAQFSDLEARIKNKYAEEEAFTKILNTTTGKVSDVLEVTRELSRVRGEIEQLETEKKYMESQTDMAEISVSLTEDAKVGAATNTWRPWQTVRDAVNRLIEQCRGLIDGIIYFVVSVLPFFVLYLFGLWMLFSIGRKVYRKMVGRQ